MCKVLLLHVYHGLPCFCGVTFDFVFLCASTYHFVVVYFSTSAAHFVICWALFLWVCCFTISTVFYYFLLLYTLPLLSITILDWSLPTSSYQSKAFCISMFSSTASYHFCVSILWAKLKICSLLSSPVYLALSIP